MRSAVASLLLQGASTMVELLCIVASSFFLQAYERVMGLRLCCSKFASTRHLVLSSS